MRIFCRLWWVVLAAVVIGAGAGAVSQQFDKPEYTSTARLFVSTQSGTSVGDAYQNNLFSQERVYSYAGLATSEQVAARAIDQAKASITVDELRAKITAVPLPQTVLKYPRFCSDLYRRIRNMPRQYSPEFRDRALRLL
ncbi:YveK family protein, partial [Mycolicibacterium diernhoferi]|uniref:YveK family protein n=1 Tax=Mycolicibacterium diernhoferi TaxID=1801 RepID=UPI0021F2DA1F